MAALAARRPRPSGAIAAGAAPPRRCAAGGAPTRALPRTALRPQGLFKYHQYQVVGRHNPTTAEPNPTVYRMKVWAPDAVCAKSKFW